MTGTGAALLTCVVQFVVGYEVHTCAHDSLPFLTVLALCFLEYGKELAALFGADYTHRIW